MAKHSWHITLWISTNLRPWEFRRSLFETTEWTYKELRKWQTDVYRLKVVTRTSQINHYKDFSRNLTQGKVNVKVWYCEKIKY